MFFTALIPDLQSHITPAPLCRQCGKIYVFGRGGLCDGCRRRPIARTSHLSPRPVPCDCGQPAVQVILVHVGDPERDNFVEERMPLCPAKRCSKPPLPA